MTTVTQNRTSGRPVAVKTSAAITQDPRGDNRVTQMWERDDGTE